MRRSELRSGEISSGRKAGNHHRHSRRTLENFKWSCSHALQYVRTSRKDFPPNAWPRSNGEASREARHPSPFAGHAIMSFDTIVDAYARTLIFAPRILSFSKVKRVQEAALALILIINRGFATLCNSCDAPRIDDRLRSKLAAGGVPTGGDVLARPWPADGCDRLKPALANGQKSGARFRKSGRKAAAAVGSDADMGRRPPAL